MQITFTIPDAKLQRIINAMKGLFPIPLDEKDAPLFTDGQWAKESLRRRIVEFVYQYELKEARLITRAGVQKDDGIVS